MRIVKIQTNKRIIERAVPESWADVQWWQYKEIASKPNISTKQVISILLDLEIRLIDSIQDQNLYFDIEKLTYNLIQDKETLMQKPLPKEYKSTTLFTEIGKTPLGMWIDIQSELKDLKELELMEAIVKKLWSYSKHKEYDYEKADNENIDKLPCFLVLKWSSFFLSNMKELKANFHKQQSLLKSLIARTTSWLGIRR